MRRVSAYVIKNVFCIKWIPTMPEKNAWKKIVFQYNRHFYGAHSAAIPYVSWISLLLVCREAQGGRAGLPVIRVDRFSFPSEQHVEVSLSKTSKPQTAPGRAGHGLAWQLLRHRCVNERVCVCAQANVRALNKSSPFAIIAGTPFCWWPWLWVMTVSIKRQTS